MIYKIHKVFISSTFEDLKDERKKVIDALLAENCMPVAMEFFAASDKTPIEIINEYMQDCDYYLLIIKGKYGSLHENTNTSFTEMEYNYAMENKIPLIACIYDQPDNLTRKEIEYENIDLRNKLETFINKIKSNHTVHGWNSAENLAQTLLHSLRRFFETRPRHGFVRTNNSSIADNPEILHAKHFDEIKIQQKKIGYIKFIHFQPVKSPSPPVYHRYLPRLKHSIPIYNEYVLFKINEFNETITGFIAKDSSTGTIDLNILNPWQPKLKLPEGTYEQTPGEIEETIHTPSKIFLTSTHYYNAFTKNQTLAIKMEKDTVKARLIIDFRYVLNDEELINLKVIKAWCISGATERKYKLKVYNIFPDYKKKFSQIEGLYWVNAENLKKGDVIKMDFSEAINWKTN
ncbi:DUF4062 domain-containing protein [Parafilimonas terrae]|uniref:DUF4062 domain-containing protein n=1 Tax=Parafilimonas terrae TaxID=1465490 RepID=A0A1I5ZE16_9BACT|nr:DUF4062 domain-containing protein [Parafilimonas terrae]SFQ54726.1 protein of unknown function [Parafilimonas terrae]